MLIAHIDDEGVVLKSAERLMEAFRTGLEEARKEALARDAAGANQAATTDAGSGATSDEVSNDDLSAMNSDDPEAVLKYWVDHGLRRNLKPDALDFETSVSGEEFFKKVKRRKKDARPLPNLVILDLKLDGVDEESGLKVLDKLKGPKGLGNIPVVMLTTHVDSDFVAQSYARGANGYVGKGDFGEFDSRFFELITHWAGTSQLPTSAA